MPQLDFLTFNLQVSMILFIFINLFLVGKNILIPQYLSFNKIQSFLWKRLILFIILFKFLSFLSFLHFLIEGSKVSKFIFLMIKKINFLKELITNKFLKFIFNKKKIFLLNINIYKNLFIFIKKEHLYNKYNFLLISKFIYIAGTKYNNYTIFLKKKSKRLIVEENLKIRFDDDEVVINNLFFFKNKLKKTLNCLFN